jgi:hypothetical protein
MTVPATTGNSSAPSAESPINVLLIGLGSIGSVYAFLLERVSDEASAVRRTESEGGENGHDEGEGG